MMRYTSGFDASTRLDVPIEGWGYLNSLPVPESPPAQRAPGTDRFSSYFGLRPAQKKDRSAKPVEYKTLYEAVERNTMNRITRKEEEAIGIFREMTRTDVEPTQRINGMRRVFRMLDGVRDLDYENYVPCLLLGHVAIERGHLTSAMNELAAAASRYPELFREGPPLASYFGDYNQETGRSEYLDGQMRNYLQMLSSAATVDELVLQAYCAMALDDRPRARLALQRASDRWLSAGARHSPGLLALIASLEYGL